MGCFRGLRRRTAPSTLFGTCHSDRSMNTAVLYWDYCASSLRTAFHKPSSSSSILRGSLTLCHSAQTHFSKVIVKTMCLHLILILAFRVSEAIENLLTLALIKRDEESRMLSVHRLVQVPFKHFMSSAERQRSFKDATILVSQAFPRRDSDIAQLYLMWDKCSLYLQHVLSLKDCCREELAVTPGFTVPPTYCDLSNACQRQVIAASLSSVHSNGM